MTRWMPADEIMSGECERMFQNGGPKVYTVEGAHRRILTPTGLSAARATKLMMPGDVVYARRKVGGRYQWMAVIEPGPQELIRHGLL